MASTDARPVPKKNTAFRHYFCIRKNDGTLITTWAGADSEVSLDGAAFGDCTNEATEIGTTGCGFIDLTNTELNTDATVLKVTVTNTDALPYVVTLFPEEAGDIRVDVTQISGDTTAADNAEAAFDTTGYAFTGCTMPWNASWDTEVQSEVDDALVAQGLDHLVSAAVLGGDVADNSIIAYLVSKEATADWDDFDNTTDGLQAIRDRGDAAWTTGGGGGSDRRLLVDTTIATLGSQTSFTLTAGSADDDAYNGSTIVIEDAATSDQKAVALISDYVGTTKTVTLSADPGIFTIAASDKVYILADANMTAAGSDPWLAALPGAYTTGTAGNIVGNLQQVTISAKTVGPDRTWRLVRGSDATTAVNTISMRVGDDVTLAMDFSQILNKGTSIASVDSVVDLLSGTITFDSLAPSQDRQKAHVDVSGVTAATTYNVSVVITTTDSQVLTGLGNIEVA